MSKVKYEPIILKIKKGQENIHTVTVDVEEDIVTIIDAINNTAVYMTPDDLDTLIHLLGYVKDREEVKEIPPKPTPVKPGKLIIKEMSSKPIKVPIKET